ncbi:penicillin-binding transpeptidase domain-containing protein [Yinghuangia soli]|uniref:Penicillin-binding protein 2 n=1 Tax=Yinghuangia soli TaxID=2908204 RepID=A0AA41PV43_9ACTN|nr:penicillin-binding transpeptidase domain-containing protein [Yinghuangia soli]MCF2526414.1 penicillin-binding protein 2 [Yinghuangia soli]
MNKPLRKVSIFCLVLVAALMLRANWIQVVKADEYADHPENKRAMYESYSHPRGDFLVDDKPITGSEKTDSKKFEYQRTYLNGPMYAPVTGFKSQFYGSNLLENVEEDILSGDDSRLFVRRVIDVVTGKERRGGNVDLTLNAKAQEAAFKGLNGKTGAAAAIDPTTGQILAMVSTPSYDPAQLAVNDKKAQDATWKALNEDPTKPMDNRVIRYTYAPGSTFKLVTAAAAIASGKYNWDTVTNFPSPMPYPNSLLGLKDQAGPAACQGSTLKVALEKSCNTVFAGIAMELGDAAIKAQAEKFGFNDFGKYDFTKGGSDTKNNLDIPTRVNASNFPANDEGGATMRAAIGQQSVTSTPLQMAMVAAAIANNGTLMEPYLVDSLRSQSLETIEQTSAKKLSQAVEPNVAGQLQDMMVGVVEEGSCQSAKIPGVKVGGKTGTAQRGFANDKRPYAWFVSFAELDGKKVAVAVVVEDTEADVERNDISGCKTAAPTAVAIMKAVLGK